MHNLCFTVSYSASIKKTSICPISFYPDIHDFEIINLPRDIKLKNNHNLLWLGWNHSVSGNNSSINLVDLIMKNLANQHYGYSIYGLINYVQYTILCKSFITKWHSIIWWNITWNMYKNCLNFSWNVKCGIKFYLWIFATHEKCDVLEYK